MSKENLNRKFYALTLAGAVFAGGVACKGPSSGSMSPVTAEATPTAEFIDENAGIIKLEAVIRYSASRPDENMQPNDCFYVDATPVKIDLRDVEDAENPNDPNDPNDWKKFKRDAIQNPDVQEACDDTSDPYLYTIGDNIDKTLG